MKISPIENQNIKSSKKVYNEIFSDASWYVNSKLKARGIHDVIANEFQNYIADKKILDLGCGYGRFSFLAGLVAKKVVGVDMTKDAIEVAKNIQKSIPNTQNIEFICEDAELFKSKKTFDFILLSGTLEHIINPEKLLKNIYNNLTSSGIFVSDSPSEFNIRGMAQATLWKLLNFPMTLSDVRIITKKYMQELMQKSGLQMNKDVIGTLYSRGWGPAFYADLSDRIPKVIKDIKNKNYDISDINIKDYLAWLNESNEYFNYIYKSWIKNNLLIPTKSFRNRDKMIIEEKFNNSNISYKNALEYMAPDFSIDPYYATNQSISMLGGNVIYSATKK